MKGCLKASLLTLIKSLVSAKILFGFAFLPCFLLVMLSCVKSLFSMMKLVRLRFLKIMNLCLGTATNSLKFQFLNRRLKNEGKSKGSFAYAY